MQLLSRHRRRTKGQAGWHVIRQESPRTLARPSSTWRSFVIGAWSGLARDRTT